MSGDPIPNCIVVQYNVFRISAASTETSTPLPPPAARVLQAARPGVGCVRSAHHRGDPVQKRRGQVTVKWAKSWSSVLEVDHRATQPGFGDCEGERGMAGSARSRAKRNRTVVPFYAPVASVFH
ncbi:protein phosphatase 1 regulatory subunit 14C [Lates japonicus]|uniref:Protein phosphatase 1 regulatory subunit 14C n=1 Tax=Lates japonicus TaxID=270547 RepID=A0AAD3NM69_LATJO|nr:protein phosphatase 1 regulatory subunit 14C [Lates japonicus]